MGIRFGVGFGFGFEYRASASAASAALSYREMQGDMGRDGET